MVTNLNKLAWLYKKQCEYVLSINYYQRVIRMIEKASRIAVEEVFVNKFRNEQNNLCSSLLSSIGKLEIAQNQGSPKGPVIVMNPGVGDNMKVLNDLYDSVSNKYGTGSKIVRYYEKGRVSLVPFPETKKEVGTIADLFYRGRESAFIKKEQYLYTDLRASESLIKDLSDEQMLERYR